MDISEIAADKGLPSRIFQSGWADQRERVLSTIPQPFGIISLMVDPNYDARGESDLFDEAAFLYRRWMHDDPRGCFTDNELHFTADFLRHHLGNGTNIWIHCVAGASRSSYITSAVLCKMLGISGKEALAIVRRDRGDKYLDTMQEAFIQHIERLFP